MLKSMLIVKENINIAKFDKLIAFIKRKSDGYKPKKSKIFTAEQIEQFLIKADDEKHLLTKVSICKVSYLLQKLIVECIL